MPLHFIAYPLRCLRLVLKYYTDQNSLKPDEEKSKCFNKLANNYKLLSDKHFSIYGWILTAIFLVTSVITNIFNEKTHPSHKANESNVHQFFRNIAIIAIVIIVLTCLALFFMRKVDDSLMHRTELTILVGIWIVFITPYCILGYLNKVPEEIPSILMIILCVLSFLFSFGMPIHLSAVKPVLQVNSAIKFNTFMEDEDPEGRRLLQKFAADNFCPQHYQFLIEVKKYQKITNQDDLFDQFNYIRLTFIEKGSRFEVNIPDQMSKNIMAYKNPASDSFDRAYAEVLKLWNTDLFPRFQKTKGAKEFIRKIKSRSLHS